MAHVTGAADHPVETRGLLVLAGVLNVAAGVIVLAKPAIALGTLAVIIGIFLLVDGVTETILALFDPPERRGAFGLILALASAVVGVLLIRHPLRGVVAVALLLGLWLIISSMIRFAAVLNADAIRGWGLGLALIEFVAGVVMVSSPGIGVRTLAVLVGVSLVVRGVVMCAVGWLLPRFLKEFGRPSGAVSAT